MLADRYGLEFSEERFRASFGQTSRDIIRTFWGDGLSEAEVQQLDEQKETLYRELIAERVPLNPGCRAALEALRRAGFARAVATSGPPENLEVVLSFGLIASYFDAQVHGFEIDRGKPAPDVFLLAAERVGVPPERCAVVEDAPVGIQAARAAGMAPIGLAGTHPAAVLAAAGPRRVVASLTELTPELVTEVLRSPASRV